MLLALSKVFVELSAPLILAFTQLAVLGDDLLALVSAPDFVIELFFLVALVFDELDDHFLALLELELLHALFLLTDQSSAALLTLFACRLSEGLLCALLQSRGLQSERARLGRCRHAHRALTQSSSDRAIGSADAR